MINGQCWDLYGLHQYKQKLLSFSLSKPTRRIEWKRVTGQGAHLYAVVQEVLGCLGRPWPILASLGRSHFFDNIRSGTEVTAQPLKHDKRQERKRKVIQEENGSLDAESIQYAILIGNALSLSTFILAHRMDILTSGI